MRYKYIVIDRKHRGIISRHNKFFNGMAKCVELSEAAKRKQGIHEYAIAEKCIILQYVDQNELWYLDFSYKAISYSIELDRTTIMPIFWKDDTIEKRIVCCTEKEFIKILNLLKAKYPKYSKDYSLSQPGYFVYRKR